jgi:hypothetical protein
MTNICVGEATPGHAIMRVIIFALIGVVFHGPHGTGLHTEPSFKRTLLPLTAVKAPVTLEIQCCLETGLGLVCWASSDHPSSCSPLVKVKIWETPYINKEKLGS